MEAIRDSVAYWLDAGSSSNQTATSRFQTPRRTRRTETSRHKPAESPAKAAQRTNNHLVDTKKRVAHNAKLKKGARIRQRIRLVTPARLFCATFVAVLCVSLIYSQMMLTIHTHSLSSCETELKVLQSEHVSLMSKYEQRYNADYIADYAENTLGMVKLGASQIEYIELSGKGGIEVSSSAPSTGGVVGSLVRGFTALLEYLR